MNVHTLGDISSTSNNNTYRPANVNQNSSNQDTQLFSPSLYKWRTFSFFILIINLFFYLIELILYYIVYKDEKSFNCILYSMGAKYTPAIVHNFQIWRFLTPVLLHASYLHILMNSIQIGFISFYIEKNLGTIKLMLLYFGAAIYGNLFSAMTNTETMGVGASGGIMGLSGFLLLFLFISFHKMRYQEKRFFIYFAISTFLNLFVSGISKDGNKVDNFAHFGGFIFGAFISIFLLKNKIDYGYFSVSKINKIKFIFGSLLVLIPVVSIVYLCTAKISSNFLGSSC